MDRLQRLQQLAAENDTDDEPEEDVTIEVEATEDDDDQLMADFFQRVKRVQDAFRVISENTDMLSQKHKDLLVSVNKDTQDKLKNEIQSFMDTISRNAQRVRGELKNIEASNQAAEKTGVYKDGSVATDLRIRKSQHSQLTKAFVKIMTRYNDVQAENKKKYTESVRRQCQVVNPDVTEDAVQQVVENGTTDGLWTGRRLQDAEAALAEIKDRHKDIQNLEKSLLELHEMFMDMALLVESQGEMIDRIEFAVEQSHNYVKRATVDVKKARQYQTKARQKMICVIICIIILIVILVAIFAT